MNIQKWINENAHDLTNKTVAITGSTGALANELIFQLAKLNANFILINRNKEKTDRQINKLLSLYPDIKVEFVECDLSNFQSVKIATEILKSKYINVLYLAAGIYNVDRYITDTGFDNVFQTNFVSHYYMVKELMQKLNSVNGKIVAISSIAYSYSTLDKNDIDFQTRKKHSKVYGNSKRFLTCSLLELAKKHNLNLSIVHPGVTLTEMTNHYPKAINWLVKIGIKILFPQKEKACLSLIKGIFENTKNYEWIGPKTLNIWGKPKKQIIKNIANKESKKIFDIAENIYYKLTEKSQKTL